MSAPARASKTYLVEYAGIRQALETDITIKGCTTPQEVAVVFQLLKYRAVKKLVTEAWFVREMSGTGLITNEEVVNALNSLANKKMVARTVDTYSNGNGGEAPHVDAIELINLKEDTLRNLNLDAVVSDPNKPLELVVFDDAVVQHLNGVPGRVTQAAQNHEMPTAQSHSVLVLKPYAVKEGLVTEGTWQAKVLALIIEGVEGTAEIARKLGRKPSDISHTKTVLEEKGVIKRLEGGRRGGRPVARKSAPAPVEAKSDSVDELIHKLDKRIESERAALGAEKGEWARLGTSIKSREERLATLTSQKSETEEMRERIKKIRRDAEGKVN